MARDITALVLAEFKAKNLRPIFFFEAWFVNGPLRLTNRRGGMSWNGYSWGGPTPTGSAVLTFSAITETTEVKAVGVQIVASGIPASLLAQCLTEIRQGLPIRIWAGVLNAAGAVIADPYRSFDGRLDQVTIDETGETATITIAAESRQIALMTPHDRRWTHEDQQIDFPGDTLFRFLPPLAQLNLVWGAKPTANSTSNGGWPYTPPPGSIFHGG